MPYAGTSKSKTTLAASRRLSAPSESEVAAQEWLAAWRIVPQSSAISALRRLGELELPVDLLANVLEQLAEVFSNLPGVETAVIQFVEFVSRVRSPLALATLFERDPEALPILMRVLSVDGRLAKIVLTDTESFDVLRLVQGKPISKKALLEDLCAELDAIEGQKPLSAALCRFHSREVLRIGYSLLTGSVSSAWVGEQLSQWFEVCCFALVRHFSRSDARSAEHQEPALRLAALGKGDGGSQTMHFDSPWELLFVFDGDAVSPQAQASLTEETDRLVRAIGNVLQTLVTSGSEVNFPLGIENGAANRAASVQSAVAQLDQYGRTWQRLELLCARPIAGRITVAQEFLHQLEPWLYRRRRTDADVDGLQFQYRKWRRTQERCLDHLVWGIKILQLTLGGDHLQVRGTNPLQAIQPLASAGVFAKSEAAKLQDLLGQIAHRRLLGQLGVSATGEEAGELFDNARNIVVAGLKQVFGEPEAPSPIADLIMDPLPASEEIAATMAPYGFEDPHAAAASFRELAQESSPFLSTRNARHYLANIGPALVNCIAKSPFPDLTLLVLSRVVESLGARGALWELFLSNPPSMELCVRLCAYAPYLSNILIANPGFIDELLDSLQLARLPSLSAMESRLDDLCKGVELEHAIHEFKSALHLRIGIRDILGKEHVDSTHQSLAQTAEVILRRIVSDQYLELCHKHGVPMVDGPKGKQECRYVLLVSGRIGALEPNYHSEIDFALIHEDDGMTFADSRSKATVSCAHFFAQLAQRSSRRLTSRGRLGQLYSVNSNLRPLAPYGPLAASLEAMRRHYVESPRSWRELLWLTKTRPAGGDANLAAELTAILRSALSNLTITPAEIEEFSQFRHAQSEGASPLNLKRALGGAQHIELLVQVLQLTFAKAHPRIMTPSTVEAISRLKADGLLTAADAQVLEEKYRFLRSIESRLRLMNTQARHDVPTSESDLQSLALFVGAASGAALQDQCFVALAQADAVIQAREATLAKELQP